MPCSWRSARMRSTSACHSWALGMCGKGREKKQKGWDLRILAIKGDEIQTPSEHKRGDGARLVTDLLLTQPNLYATMLVIGASPGIEDKGDVHMTRTIVGSQDSVPCQSRKGILVGLVGGL